MAQNLEWENVEELLQKCAFKMEDFCPSSGEPQLPIKKEPEESTNEMTKSVEVEDENELKEKYYEKAVRQWSSIPDIEIPKMSELPEVPIMYNGEELLTPEEWADNNHPLWNKERTLVQNVLLNKTPSMKVAKFVNSKWGNNTEVNTFQDTSTFPGMNNKKKLKMLQKSEEILNKKVMNAEELDKNIVKFVGSRMFEDEAMLGANMMNSTRELLNFNSLYAKDASSNIPHHFVKQMISMENTAQLMSLYYN